MKNKAPVEPGTTSQVEVEILGMIIEARYPESTPTIDPCWGLFIFDHKGDKVYQRRGYTTLTKTIAAGTKWVIKKRYRQADFLALADYPKILRRGTQIAYIPNHANGNLAHPDVDFWFVTSITPNAAFCRYWIRGRAGTLRTKLNSEKTSFINLAIHRSVNQAVVDQALIEIDRGV